MTIRVLVVDDHPLMRQAICTAIAIEADIEVAGEARNGVEAVSQALALRPDVIVMDLLMPIKDGVQAIAEIRAADPNARILALTSSLDPDKIVATLEAGAQGYLFKDTQREELLRAIRDVSQGLAFLPPPVAHKLISRMRDPGTTTGVETLTQREMEVLRLIGKGLSNKEIARALVLSEATARVHVHNILGKLGFEHRGQLIAYAIREGLVGD
jgi:NarL family two-component system response regulator LiaR